MLIFIAQIEKKTKLNDESLLMKCIKKRHLNLVSSTKYQKIN